MRAFLALLSVTYLSGCIHTHEVRYVYQDRDFGVVGMPENTDLWPTHYRRKGEKLMNAHFPEGHEIVRAEEVIEGERTLKVEGSNSAEVSPQVSDSLIKVVKLGHSTSRSEAETVKVKECRIIYRRACSAKPKGYAEAATLTPSSYVDPNAAERRKAAEAPTVKTKPAGEQKTDDKAPKPPGMPIISAKAPVRRPDA
jgi:hypothetical protein